MAYHSHMYYVCPYILCTNRHTGTVRGDPSIASRLVMKPLFKRPEHLSIQMQLQYALATWSYHT